MMTLHRVRTLIGDKMGGVIRIWQLCHAVKMFFVGQLV